MARVRQQLVSVGLLLLLVVVIFLPVADSRFVSKSEWSTAIGSTSDIAELKWDIQFEIESAPSQPFAYVSTHGQELLRGFHLTIDLYGNGFLVLSDVHTKTPINQIVWLGHPITGKHQFTLHFQQLDRSKPWKSVELFFDGVEVPFHSGDPKKILKIQNINFVPDALSSTQLATKPRSGEIVKEQLVIRTWNKSGTGHRPLLALSISAAFLVIQVRRRMRAE